MTCKARRLLFDYYREKSRKPCPTRLPRFFFKMAEICATPAKPLRRRTFRLDGLITPTFQASPVEIWRKALPHLRLRERQRKNAWSLTTIWRLSPKPTTKYAPVAQLDRVTDSDSVGRWFESSRAYQKDFPSAIWQRENLLFNCLRRWTKGYTIKQPNMDCQPTEITALMRHRAVFS